MIRSISIFLALCSCAAAQNNTVTMIPDAAHPPILGTAWTGPGALARAIAAVPPGATATIQVPAGYTETLASSITVSSSAAAIQINGAPGSRITVGGAYYAFTVGMSNFSITGSLTIDGGGTGGCVTTSTSVSAFQWVHDSTVACQNTGGTYEGLTWSGTLSESDIDGVIFSNMNDGAAICIECSIYNVRFHNVTVNGTTNNDPIHIINDVTDGLPCTNGLVIDGLRVTNFFRIGLELQGSNWCGGNVIIAPVFIGMRPNSFGCISMSTGEEANGTLPNGYHQIELLGHIVCQDQTIYSGTVNTSGTSVTWVSGSKFYTNQNQITIAGVQYETNVTSNTATSLTLLTSAGTQTGAAYTAANNLAIGIEAFGDNLDVADFAIEGAFCQGISFGGKNANIHDGTLKGMRDGCTAGPPFTSGTGILGNPNFDLSNPTIERVNIVEPQSACVNVAAANVQLGDNTCSRTPGWYGALDASHDFQGYGLAASLQPQITGKANVHGNRMFITGLNATASGYTSLLNSASSGATSFTTYGSCLDFGGMSPFTPFSAQLDTGGNAETVTISAINTSTCVFTTSALTKNHSMGALVTAIWSSSVTSMVLTSYTTPPPLPFTILMDSEQMTVTALAFRDYGFSSVVQYTATVTRGVNSTSAAQHLGGAVATLEPVTTMVIDGFVSGLGASANGNDASWTGNACVNNTVYNSGIYYLCFVTGTGSFQGEQLSGNTYDGMSQGFATCCTVGTPYWSDNVCLGGTTDATCGSLPPITITPGTGLTGGGSVVPGGSVSVAIAPTGSGAGTVGGATSIPVFSYNAEGQLTSVSTISIPTGTFLTGVSVSATSSTCAALPCTPSITVTVTPTTATADVP